MDDVRGMKGVGNVGIARRVGWSRRALAATGVALLVCVTACAADSGPDEIDVAVFVVRAGLWDDTDVGETCRDGQTIEVRGAADELVGRDDRVGGDLEVIPGHLPLAGERSCALRAQIEVTESDFYQIELLGWRTAPAVVSASELEEQDGIVELVTRP